MQLIMLGAPGVGKGTQGKLLAAYYKIPNISTGEILRSAIANGTALGAKAKIYVDQGALVPDQIMISLIRERLQQDDCTQGFILDGFPRTVEQASALDQILNQIQKDIDYVIMLELPQFEILKRLTARRVCRNCGKDYNLISDPPPVDNRCKVCQGDIIQRSDDNEETVLARLQVYEEKTTPLKDYYQKQGRLKLVNAEGSIEEVQNRIRSYFDVEHK